MLLNLPTRILLLRLSLSGMLCCGKLAYSLGLRDLLLSFCPTRQNPGIKACLLLRTDVVEHKSWGVVTSLFLPYAYSRYRKHCHYVRFYILNRQNSVSGLLL